MSSGADNSLAQIAAFVNQATPPVDARSRAANAILDTIGVALAGSIEPAARIVRGTLEPQDPRTLGLWDRRTSESFDRRTMGACSMWGTPHHVSPPDAPLANGTAAHALDFDDMCFVSLAHPSAPAVPAIIAAGEMTGASGRAVLDAYIAGFEIQARLGRLMNPRHYQRGWHCTSTLGVMSARRRQSIARPRQGRRRSRTRHRRIVSVWPEGKLRTMVKPLHADWQRARRDGRAAAKGGMTAGEKAIDGPQGYCTRSMRGEDLDRGFRSRSRGRFWIPASR